MTSSIWKLMANNGYICPQPKDNAHTSTRFAESQSRSARTSMLGVCHDRDIDERALVIVHTPARP